MFKSIYRRQQGIISIFEQGKRYKWTNLEILFHIRDGWVFSQHNSEHYLFGSITNGRFWNEQFVSRIPSHVSEALRLFNKFFTDNGFIESKTNRNNLNLFLSLPWNQSTLLGYFAKICFNILLAECYLIFNGMVLLLFIFISRSTKYSIIRYAN